MHMQPVHHISHSHSTCSGRNNGKAYLQSASFYGLVQFFCSDHIAMPGTIVELSPPLLHFPFSCPQYHVRCSIADLRLLHHFLRQEITECESSRPLSITQPERKSKHCNPDDARQLSAYVHACIRRDEIVALLAQGRQDGVQCTP